MGTRGWLSLMTVLMMAAMTFVPPPAGADAGARGPTPNTDSEPNDDFSGATVVSPSGSSITFSGTCDQNDVNDYYKIQLVCNPPQSEKLTVSTYCAEGLKRLFIYDPLGNYLMLDGDANQFTDHTVSTVAFTTGYYYVRYENQLLSATASYSITFQKEAATYNGLNNTPATATPVADFPATLGGNLDDPNEQADWFTMDLVNNVTSADVITFSCQASANLAARVGVYFTNLSYLEPFHYETVDNNDTGLANKDEGSFGAPAEGTYYLRVLAVKGTGTYTLKLWRTSVVKDDWDSAETAMGLPDAAGGHYIEFEDTLGKDVDNEDFFVFPASEGQIINATLWSLDYDATLDRPQITMELRDSTNQSYGASTGIAKSIAHADGVSPETTTTSYLRVALMTYQGGAGRYRVNITMDMPPTIFEGMWETPFTVNDSSWAVLNLTTVFYDPDYDHLTYSAVNNAAGKTMVHFKNDEANFSAEVEPGWTGMENYTVTAADPFGYTAVANIHAEVVAVNHPPYITNFEMPDISCYPGDKLFTDINLNLNLSDYFFDDDIYNPALNDYLDYKVANYDPLDIRFHPVPGTLKDSGGITIIVPEMPDLIAPLTIVVAFWAEDTLGLATPPLTCNITVNPPVNHAPRWTTNFTLLEMNESTAGSPTEAVLDLNTLCTDPDPWDSGNLTFAAKGYNPNGFTVSIVNGFAKIVPKVGFYTMPPHETLTLNATDTKGESAELTITIMVWHTYYPPVPGPDWKPPTFNVNANEGDSVNFSVTMVIDPQIANLTPMPVKYRWYVNGTIQTATTGNFTFRTDFTTAARSPYNVTFVFNDSVSEAHLYWKVTVQNVNQPPMNVKIVSPAWPRLNFTSGDKITFQAALATDPDDPNATLTYEWKDAGVVFGNGLTYETSKLLVGKHMIVLVVTDPDGAVVEENVTINVKVKPTPPFIPGMELAAAMGAMGLAAVVVAVFARRRK